MRFSSVVPRRSRLCWAVSCVSNRRLFDLSYVVYAKLETPLSFSSPPLSFFYSPGEGFPVG